jgi:acyl-CoA thioesterase I
MRRIIAAAVLGWVAAGCGSDRRAADGAPPSATAEPGSTVTTDARPVVLFLGTSLTAGLGLDPDQAYPALIQQKIDSALLDFRAVNAGVSGETSADGRRRIGWLLQVPIRVLVLELGANDALRGQDLEALRHNLQAIIDSTRAHDPDVRIVIAGMEAPPNLGPRYTKDFRDLFRDLARRNGAALIPFLLTGVAGRPALNQADGIHPTAAGARIVAENVWRVLEPVLRVLPPRPATDPSSGPGPRTGASPAGGP